jgi:rare lipoprotein A
MLPTHRRGGRLPLRRAIRLLGSRSRTYKRLFIASVVMLLAMGVALAFAPDNGPEAVLLGEGHAGLLEELHDPSDPLAYGDTDPETEPVPLDQLEGSPAGEGPASFYGQEFAGRPTASGERFDPAAMTAAHRTLPMGSRVRVTNLRNGRSVVVRINDRGPFHGNRVIDLSRAAASELGFVRSGTAPVQMELLPRRG